MMLIDKIISGGQTGADQAGLAAASALGIPTGGVAPKGWRTEAGPAPWLGEHYGLTECLSSDYDVRTARNVFGSDGTIIFGNHKSRGSMLAINLCVQMHKSCRLMPIPIPFGGRSEFLNWLSRENIRILNVAGNRESRNRGIYDAVLGFLVNALEIR